MFVDNNKAGLFERELFWRLEGLAVVRLIDDNKDAEHAEILCNVAKICGHLFVRFIYF